MVMIIMVMIMVILVIVSVGSTHAIVLKHLTAGLIIIIMIMMRSQSYPIKYYVDIRDCHQTKAARKIMTMMIKSRAMFSLHYDWPAVPLISQKLWQYDNMMFSVHYNWPAVPLIYFRPPRHKELAISLGSLARSIFPLLMKMTCSFWSWKTMTDSWRHIVEDICWKGGDARGWQTLRGAQGSW